MSAHLDMGLEPISIAQVGSRITCNPAPDNTDRDWLVLVGQDQWGPLDFHLSTTGWDWLGSLNPHKRGPTPPDESFCSYSKKIDGVLENLICTDSPVFYQRFLAATSVAKRLNLLDKADRIALFQAVLYANGDEVNA